MINMTKNYTISIEEEYNRKWEIIAKREYSDKSKLLRKWIDQSFKEEYNHE